MIQEIILFHAFHPLAGIFPMEDVSSISTSRKKKIKIVNNILELTIFGHVA